jgi:hypothetical protein
MTFYFGEFEKKFSGHFNFHLEWASLPILFHGCLQAFLRVSLTELAKYLSEREMIRIYVVENYETQTLGSMHFFL